jgi:hypothetical protein
VLSVSLQWRHSFLCVSETKMGTTFSTDPHGYQEEKKYVVCCDGEGRTSDKTMTFPDNDGTSQFNKQAALAWTPA